MAVTETIHLSSTEIEGRWGRVFESPEIRRRILALVPKYPESHSLELSFPDIDALDSSLADHLLQFPEETLQRGEITLKELPSPLPGTPLRLRLRIRDLPANLRIPIHLLREEHLNRLLTVEGIVRRMTEVRPQIQQAVFECLACKGRTSIEQDDVSQTLKEATVCSSCNKPIGKTKFTLLSDASVYINSQKLEVQENPENLRGGAHPEGLTLLLTDDLVGTVIPGNRVEVTGVLRSIPRTNAKGMASKYTVFDLVLMANEVQREDKEYREIEISDDEVREIEALRGQEGVFDRFVSSMAPSIQGMRIEKEAIALQLFGGVPKVQPDGVKIRGDIHVLIVGDPGIAKSQLLRYVAENIAPRGIYTSGKGTTAAGLTAAAVKDDFGGGRWTLEAGAMVLADQGELVIDEFDKMTDNDRSALHEGLESQTISISKAGIMAQLRARCPVLAAANPKLGRFTPDKVPAEEIDLPPTLLSRFDVIFALLDKPESEKDRRLAGAILAQHIQAEEREARGARSRGTEEIRPAATGDLFTPDFMRKYIAYAKRNVFPVIDATANQTILDFFLELRKQGEGENKPVPITFRQVEALVRLTEASARSRLSPIANQSDANRAVAVMRHFLKTVLSSGESPLDIDYISTGISSNKRLSLIELQEMLADLQKQTTQGFTLEEVVQEGEKRGMPKEKVMKLWHEMQRLNQLYEPRTGSGFWKLMV